MSRYENFKVWIPDRGETVDTARECDGLSAEGAVLWYVTHVDYGDFDIAREGATVHAQGENGPVQIFEVGAENRPHYFAKRVERGES